MNTQNPPHISEAERAHMQAGRHLDTEPTPDWLQKLYARREAPAPAATATYRVVACFVSKDGARRRYRTIGKGLSVWVAIEAKEDIVLNTPNCIGAACYPEVSRG